MNEACSEEWRRSVLEDAGARGGEIEELLGHSAAGEWWRTRPSAVPEFPLDDEPHAVDWLLYEEEARARGAWTVLQERLIQLRFPIREGMSQDQRYRAATLRGVEPFPAGPGAEIEAPDELSVEVYGTLAGRVPILATGNRRDFETLVQALTARNEPWPVPVAMGACLVNGLNNWNRIHSYRRRWQSAGPDREGEGAWKEEFRRLIPRKELYQDRLIILSKGRYSGVAGDEVGEAEERWLERSMSIRREHECTHFLALRLFGALRHDVLEELVADFVGIVRTYGTYKPGLALRFLGLERFPEFREGGRLEVYRGEPPLSDGAFKALQELVRRGVANLARLAEAHAGKLASEQELGRLVVAMTLLACEELAAEDLVTRVEERLAELMTGGSACS
ncbi:MAG: hypothetical protein LJE95_01060 [Acidobacteria bacterium]|jgi:hypothetical protein|nr:hypothetical protein [Acidobacteriota bacterium]